jgi:hypothetical protein
MVGDSGSPRGSIRKGKDKQKESVDLLLERTSRRFACRRTRPLGYGLGIRIMTQRVRGETGKRKLGFKNKSCGRVAMATV